MLPQTYIHNTRSLYDDEFLELKSLACSYDLLMVTETWLNEKRETLYNIDG